MKRRIRILGIYIGITLLVVVIAVFAAVRVGMMGNGIRSMQEITEEYIASQQAVRSMRAASNDLTEQAREYVIGGGKAHLEAYLDEIYEEKRRDSALDVLESYQSDSASLQALQAAVDSSNELAETEMYAMRMAAEAFGMGEDELEEYFGGIELTPQDAALSGEEKRSAVVSLMFDENYTRLKEEIQERSYASLEDLIESMRVRQIDSYRQATERLDEVQALFFVLLGATLFALLVTALLVILPLTRSLRYIRASQKLPLQGAAEYAYLAETYNHMLEMTREQQEQLSFEATHDELTGLYNRKVFEDRRRSFSGGIAMLMIDVDRFKSINDTYGHETGDRVLKKVAEILTRSFRADDYVCRIGGDEFAVIMKNTDPGLREIVQAKIDAVRSALAAETELPPTTLSIGVAFSGEDGREDVYRKADAALYRVKDKGCNGYSFYEE